MINGYYIKRPQHNRNFCERCGAETITICESCKVEIHGYYIVQAVIFSRSEFKIPYFCHNCGKPYPWTETKIKIAQERIKELEDVSSEDREILNQNIQNIAVDNPKTELATMKINKVIKKYIKTTGKIIYKIFIDIASETAKKMLKGE